MKTIEPWTVHRPYYGLWTVHGLYMNVWSFFCGQNKKYDVPLFIPHSEIILW